MDRDLVDKVPVLGAETHQKVLAFQNNQYETVLDLNRAYESIKFRVGLELSYIAAAYIASEITPYWEESSARISGLQGI